MEASAEEAATRCLQAAPSQGEPIKLSTADPRTKANREAFLERVKAKEAIWERAREEYLSGARTPRERRFVRDLSNFWRDATWMVMTGQFPDGKPLRQQNVHHLELWNIFLVAMHNRELVASGMAQVEGGGRETEGGGPEEIPEGIMRGRMSSDGRAQD